MYRQDERCCLCGAKILTRGHNIRPLKRKIANNSDKCCSACNILYVVPARLKLMEDNTHEQSKTE